MRSLKELFKKKGAQTVSMEHFEMVHKKYEDALNTCGIYQKYIRINSDILNAAKEGASYIPFEEWTSCLRTPALGDFTKEDLELIERLERELSAVAVNHGYSTKLGNSEYEYSSFCYVTIK